VSVLNRSSGEDDFVVFTVEQDFTLATVFRCVPILRVEEGGDSARSLRGVVGLVGDGGLVTLGVRRRALELTLALGLEEFAGDGEREEETQSPDEARAMKEKDR